MFPPVHPSLGHLPLGELLYASKLRSSLTYMIGHLNQRSSVQGGRQWSGGRQSMLPPTPLPSHSLKDPRNIRDKGYQQTLRNTIFAWLQESQFQGTISKQTLLSPTAKDFRTIFEHFVRLLDPTYSFGENGRRFDDEVVLILKAHRYPFADNIDKKWLAAPASMHSWPSLLAMLHWLAELSKVSVNTYSGP